MVSWILCLVILGLHSFGNASSDTYKVGIVNNFHIHQSQNYLEQLKERLTSMNIDLLLLSSKYGSADENDCGTNHNNDEIIQKVSKIASVSKTHVYLNMKDKQHCNDQYVLFDNNMVFNRDGRILSVFRTAVNQALKCNATSIENLTFDTDFGVRFRHITQYDIVSKSPEQFIGEAKNFILAGSWRSELPFMTVAHLSTWSHINGVNLISPNLKPESTSSLSNDFTVIDMLKVPEKDVTTSLNVQSAVGSTFSHEELSQYCIKSLNLETSLVGYTDQLCHDEFCCHFYVKTSREGSSKQEESSYSLLAYDGIRQYGTQNQLIGIQTCAIVACTGLYKRTCVIESKNNSTSTVFDEIVISGNFTKENTQQFPTALDSTFTPITDYKITVDVNENYKKATLRLQDSKNVIVFGIFGRDYAKDNLIEKYDNSYIVYDYIFSDDMQEVYNYIWVRLRVLMFVVSIYFLEMM